MRTRWIIIILALATGVVTWAWINSLNQSVADLTPATGQFTPSPHVFAPNGPSASAGGCTGVCGITITVPAGGNLQTAINSANIGDTIDLAAGATYSGSFTLPNKPANGSAYLTITTGGFSVPAGQRVKPSDASQMAKLTNTALSPMILTAPGANHYQLIGLEVFPGDNRTYTNDGIRLGDVGTNQNTIAQVPHDIIIDRIYEHAFSTITAMKRGIALNSSNSSILNSYIADMKDLGQDTQAICGWNGPGNLTITNNYLEASGENVLFGGADPSIPGLIANNGVQIRNNFFFKPFTWMLGNPAYAGQKWVVKNLLESKNMQNAVIDGNLLENSWTMGQTGFAYVAKSSNQGGTAPQSVSQNEVFSNNIVAHVGIGTAINHTTNPNALNIGTNHITLQNNLFEDVSAAKYGGYGYGVQTTGSVDQTVITHNTFDNDSVPLQISGNTSVGFDYQNNIAAYNLYGIIGTGTSPGDASISKYFTSAVIDHNVLAGGSAVKNASLYKATAPNNFFDASVFSSLFVNSASGDYHLAAGTYKGKASDATDIGVNYTILNAAQANSSAPVPTTTAGSTPTGSTVAPAAGGVAPGAAPGITSIGTDSAATASPGNGATSSSAPPAGKSKTTSKTTAVIPTAVVDTSKSYVRVDGNAVAADDKHYYSVVIGVKDLDGNFILKLKPTLAMGGGQTTVSGPTQVGNEWIYTVSSNQVGDRMGAVMVGAKTLANIKITFLPIEVAKLKQDQLVNVGAVLSDLEAKLAAEQASNPTLLLASPEKLDLAQKVAVGSLISFASIGVIWWIRRRIMIRGLAGAWNSH